MQNPRCGGLSLLTGIKHWIPDHAHWLAGDWLRLSVGARAEDTAIFHFHLDRAVFWSVVRAETHKVGHHWVINNRHKMVILKTVIRVYEVVVVGETVVGVARKKFERRTLATNSGVRECVGSCSEVTKPPALRSIYASCRACIVLQFM